MQHFMTSFKFDRDSEENTTAATGCSCGKIFFAEYALSKQTKDPEINIKEHIKTENK